jgi:hypothetical protein
MRLELADEPGAADHVCTPADFVQGPVARFETNLAALALLKTLAAEGRPATSEDRALLARFSGFGDSTFEPAFRLSAHRLEDNAWVERGQRLRSMVNDGKWQSLERSRLNAFFTSPDVIAAMWEGCLRWASGACKFRVSWSRLRASGASSACSRPTQRPYRSAPPSSWTA